MHHLAEPAPKMRSLVGTSVLGLAGRPRQTILGPPLWRCTLPGCAGEGKPQDGQWARCARKRGRPKLGVGRSLESASQSSDSPTPMPPLDAPARQAPDCHSAPLRLMGPVASMLVQIQVGPRDRHSTELPQRWPSRSVSCIRASPWRDRNGPALGMRTVPSQRQEVQ